MLFTIWLADQAVPLAAAGSLALGSMLGPRSSGALPDVFPGTTSRRWFSSWGVKLEEVHILHVINFLYYLSMVDYKEYTIIAPLFKVEQFSHILASSCRTRHVIPIGEVECRGSEKHRRFHSFGELRRISLRLAGFCEPARLRREWKPCCNILL